MKFFTYIVLVLALLASTVVRADQKSAKWKSTMHQMVATLSELLYFSYSSGGEKKENDQRIKDKLKEFRDIAEKTHSSGTSPDDDPGSYYIAKTFTDDLKNIQNEFSKGRKKDALMALRSVTHYCMSCHTRNNKGIEFKNYVLPNFNQMKPLEKAQLLAATRQYEKALNEFDHALTQKSLGKYSPIEWEIGVKKSLALAVRVRRDPNLALELMSRLFDKKSIPTYIKADLKQWRKDVDQWSLEQSKELSRKQKVSLAGKLIDRKISNQNKNFIYNLRASTYLHDVLSKPKQDITYLKSLYLAGVVTERLSEINFDGFSGYYFANCIWKFPKSTLAKACYARLDNFYRKKYGRKKPTYIKDYLKTLKNKMSISKK